MELLLDRYYSDSKVTNGNLSIDGIFECFTVEDTVRVDPNPDTPENEAKVKGQTAIPAGRYRVIITYSTRFKRLLPLLLNVPGFIGIRFHPGNDENSTEGCIVVGSALKNHRIPFGFTKPAFEALFKKMQDVKEEEIWIEVR